jgi:hypothetical protein
MNCPHECSLAKDKPLPRPHPASWARPLTTFEREDRPIN